MAGKASGTGNVPLGAKQSLTCHSPQLERGESPRAQCNKDAPCPGGPRITMSSILCPFLRCRSRPGTPQRTRLQVAGSPGPGASSPYLTAVTSCLQSTPGLSAAVVHLGLCLTCVRQDRLLSGPVVVSLGGQYSPPADLGLSRSDDSFITRSFRPGSDVQRSRLEPVLAIRQYL